MKVRDAIVYRYDNGKIHAAPLPSTFVQALSASVERFWSDPYSHLDNPRQKRRDKSHPGVYERRLPSETDF